MDSTSGEENQQLQIGKWTWRPRELHSNSLDAVHDGHETFLRCSPGEVLSSSDETCSTTSAPSVYIETHRLTRVSLMRNAHGSPERRNSINKKNELHLATPPPELAKSVSDAFDPFATHPSGFPPDVVNRCNVYRKYHRRTMPLI